MKQLFYLTSVIIVSLPCVLFPVLSCCHYNELPGDKVVIMSYNVQAFFDEVDNGTEYSEYDPGTGNWDKEFFLEKTRRISRVIKESVPGGPDIVALQEVENAHALETLCNNGLKGLGYRYRVIVPARDTATNTAILSRLSIKRVRAYSLHEYCGNPGRKIVEVEIYHYGKILYLFNNHWKSKLGGTAGTEKSRKEAAGLIVSRINAILYDNPDADIIILGDLNENRDEYLEIGRVYQTALIPLSAEVPSYYRESSLFLSDNGDFITEPGGKVIFFEPWYEESGKCKGSYVYKNEWQTPDHILLSRGLFCKKGFKYKDNSFQVMDSLFLIDPKTGYPTAWNHRKKDYGYSDHLPLFITVLFTNE
ncbi:MAG: endonuclease/exonuclease/phosphatase family protein [Spirochaetales bacterium]|nr:endonuclease/exonuclease/phosphatase family protein [Spirochaetales bacterium]